LRRQAPDQGDGATLARSAAAASPDPSVPVRAVITIGRPASEIYKLWRDFENLPRFMSHIRSVEVLDRLSSRWHVSVSGRDDLTWDAVVSYAYDRTKQALMLETKRATALREAIRACRNGGIVSVVGVYGGLIDKFPMGSLLNRGLTMRGGQCHVHRYLEPLMGRIERGEIDPSFVITHRLRLDQAPEGFEMFLTKKDSCEKVVLSA